MADTNDKSSDEREKARRDLMRSVETPKRRQPTSMTREEEEAMIFALVEETGHEMAEELRRSRKQKDGALT